MKRSEIEALSNDPAVLKREIVRLNDIVDSHEQAKAQRAKEAAIAAESPAAALEMDVFNMKSELEGLSDGSGADPENPIERGKVCRDAIALIGRLFDALPKK